MSQSRNRQINRRAVNTEPTSKVETGQRQRKRTPIIIAAVVFALILAIFGAAYYPTYIAPFRHVIIKVDDTNIRMDYFLKRLKLEGGDPVAMLRTLTQEQLVKPGALRYGIEVTTEDITQGLRRIASGGSANETISDTEFRAWLRQTTNDTGFSEKELRDLIATRLMTARLQEYLAERMPTVAEQAHVHAILVATEKEAEQVKARLDAGEDFAALAREVSVDENSGENGGDLGWVIRGILEPQVDYEVWAMSPGNVSDPILYYDPSDPEAMAPVGYYILKVSERSDAREVDEKYLPVLESRLLGDWYSEEWESHEVEWHGLKNGFDSYTNAWIGLQLQKE
ncbi:MAG: peptidylprolyl isomerase [Dehalococcoidales bacterium]|nr:peptidylprolyl isomerase [Dehalococcoidales bacterium]